MINKKWLDKLDQEELYDLFLKVTERIENETIEKFSEEKANIVPFSNYIDPAFELLTDPDKIHGIATGYSEIDFITKGFESSELIVVGAVEGVGKSMFVQNIFHNMGKRKIPNLFISMEMSNVEAEKRYIEMEMDASKVKKEEASEIVKNLPFYAYETENMNLDELDEKIGKAIKEYNVKIIGIDHLHYFAPQDTQNSSAVIGYLIRRLKIMARKHQIPLVVISHLTKLKKKGMPDKSALRDSSFIAQDADTVIMLNRDWMAEDLVKRKTLEFSVQKNRTRGFLGEGKLFIQQHYKVTEEQ